jgi:hypothetical protein
LVGIAIVAIVTIAAIMVLTRRRTAAWRERFGPEYERTVSVTGQRRDAETELVGPVDETAGSGEAASAGREPAGARTAVPRREAGSPADSSDFDAGSTPSRGGSRQ